MFLNGRLEHGLEIVLAGGRIQEVRPQRGLPEPAVLSPAFVNAHSHLEYGGLLDRIDERGYWPWIRRLTALKEEQRPEAVRRDARSAAQANRRTGVSLIGEHSDRPFSGEAMAAAGLRGRLFQEVITLKEAADPSDKLAAIRQKAATQSAALGEPVYLAAHTPYTVDEQTLRAIGFSGEPTSMHVAETELEAQFFREGAGPIAGLYEMVGQPPRATGETAFEVAERCGFNRPGSQLVHACDLSDDEVGRIASSGAVVAHCPRSNLRLGCPLAKVRRMLEAGVRVGLGMDSAASSGPIDMFAEMRAALKVARLRGEPLTAGQVWSMATTLGAASIGVDGWDVSVGRSIPLISIRAEPDWTLDDLVAQGSPDRVEWIETDV